MNARVTNADILNSFTYKRAAVKVSAYGKEYELPVRTTEFCDKQDAIDRKIMDTSKQRTSAEVVECFREGVALFIGAEEAERIFPKAQTGDIDIDEITVFYSFLKDRSLQNLIEYTKKYSPNKIRR